MQISVVNHQVPASPFTRCLVTGKSVRLLVPQLFFYKVGVLTYTFLLELSKLKEGKHKSESLWWRVFVDCGVVETGYGPRHLISTLPPPLTQEWCYWLFSHGLTSPFRSQFRCHLLQEVVCVWGWLPFTPCPVILYCIIFILSQGALTTVCNSHLIDLPSCSLSLTECWLNEGRGFVHCLYL